MCPQSLDQLVKQKISKAGRIFLARRRIARNQPNVCAKTKVSSPLVTNGLFTAFGFNVHSTLARSSAMQLY